MACDNVYVVLTECTVEEMADSACAWCKVSVDVRTCNVITFGVCNHVMHEACRDVARHVHQIASCTTCVPVTVPALDLGDDSLLERKRHEVRYNDRLKHILARSPFEPSEIRVHCQEMYAQRHPQPGTVGTAGTAGGLTSLMRIFGRGESAVGPASPQPGETYNPHAADRDRAHDFARNHRSPDAFREMAITFVTLYEAGVTIDDLVKVGQYKLQELHAIGMDWVQLQHLGLTWEHLKDPFVFHTADMQEYFGVDYMKVIRLCAGKAGEQGDLSLGVERFCKYLFNLKDMQHLHMDDMQLLMNHGMTRADFYSLAQSLTLEDMLALKLTKEHLEKLDLVSLDAWVVMKWGEPEAVCAKLGIPMSRFAPEIKEPAPALPAPRPIKRQEDDIEVTFAVQALRQHERRHGGVGRQRYNGR